jgi:hypothetical protein
MNKKIVLFMCAFFFVTYTGISLATEKSHNQAARELAELSFNESAYHQNAMRYALLAIKDRFEANPKTKPYSAIIINAAMEVMEAYIRDPETQTKVKGITAQLYMKEFTETELREMVKFYRSKTGQKALSKLPAIMQKQWELESQMEMPPKYEQMLVEKITNLQKQGKLPDEIK